MLSAVPIADPLQKGRKRTVRIRDRNVHEPGQFHASRTDLRRTAKRTSGCPFGRCDLKRQLAFTSHFSILSKASTISSMEPA
ncbi:MAG: hypothetical protein P1V13_19340 [Rhizobiaceae bacterium]|nr:hypothetical protein [Rhizobiaceae bacterium]